MYLYIFSRRLLSLQRVRSNFVHIKPGAHLTNAIQILWKLCVTLTSILRKWSLQHRSNMAQLSCHVVAYSKPVAIRWAVIALQLGDFSIEFELSAKHAVVKWASGIVHQSGSLVSRANSTCLDKPWGSCVSYKIPWGLWCLVQKYWYHLSTYADTSTFWWSNLSHFTTYDRQTMWKRRLCLLSICHAIIKWV